MKKGEKQKGITLISLVITVIILLILALVVINLAVNSNGLFDKTGEAANKWNSSVASEEQMLENMILKANEINGGATLGDSGLPKEWEASKIADIITETSEVEGIMKERKVPVPTGYVASQIQGEDTISEGLVIYEGTEPVSGEKDGEYHTNAMQTRNQYVWIPVDDINDMVMCKNNTAESVCNLILQDDGTLKCETHDSDELCGRLYVSRLNEEYISSTCFYYTNMNFQDRSHTWSQEANHEPAVASDIDLDKITGDVNSFTTNITNKFKNMAKSVAIYHGFYISRYSVRKNSNNKLESIKTNSYSDSLSGNWYSVQNELDGSGFHMLFGCQYDQCMKFVGEPGEHSLHSDRDKINDCVQKNVDFDCTWSYEFAEPLYPLSRGPSSEYSGYVTEYFYPHSARHSSKIHTGAEIMGIPDFLW